MNNLRSILGVKKLNTVIADDTGELILNFDATQLAQQNKYIKGVLNHVGYTNLKKNLNEQTKIPKEQFQKTIDTVTSSCDFFIDQGMSQPLFGYAKSNINIHDINSFMRFFNSILKDWGIKIKMIKKSKYKMVDNKRKNVGMPDYSIIYLDGINKYI